MTNLPNPPQPNPGTPRAAVRLDVNDVLAAAGFACLLATMLIYSAAAMPFQRFETLPGIVAVLSRGVRAGAVAGLAAATLAGFGMGRVLRHPAMRVALDAAFLAGNALFCAMVLGGAGPDWAMTAAGVLVGAGCTGQALAWGRVLARYGLRRATGVVAAAAVGAALLGWAQLAVSEAAAVTIFMVATLGCVALGRVLGHADAPAADEAGEKPAGGERVALWPRVRAFFDVALVPTVGLALFAMLMAVRGELFFEDYTTYVVTQVVVAALLLACMLLPARVPLMRAVYRGLIPLLGTLVLVVNYMSEAVFGGSRLEVSMVIVLYTAAALLTLSTLAAMAHAAEFSADLISSLTVALFCAVTFACQRGFSSLANDAEGVRTLIVLTSGLYAAGMVVLTIWRALKSEDAAVLDATAEAAGVRAGLAGAGAGHAAGSVGVMGAGIESLTLDERCDSLAQTHGLTAREREILGYLARGHTSAYIGDELVISPNTVRTHVHNIYRKLGVASREDVLRLTRS